MLQLDQRQWDATTAAAIASGRPVRLTGVTAVRALPEYLEIEGQEGLRLRLQVPATWVHWLGRSTLPEGQRQLALFLRFPTEAPATLLLQQRSGRLALVASR